VPPPRCPRLIVIPLPHGPRLPTVRACQFAEGNIGEPYWVALSLIDVSKDYNANDCITSSLPFIRAERDWRTLSYAAVMAAMASGL
jgi:hypothetical protein